MIKKGLAILGVGSASVDLRLDRSDVEQGGTLDAEVVVEGGWVEQEVEGIKYAVRSEYAVETDEGETHETHTLAEGRLADGFTIGSGEQRTFEATVDIPLETPTSRGSDEVWIDTALDIEWANDPEDSDRLRVEPGPRLAASLEAIDALGFTLDSVENDNAGGTLVEEFEFRARSGPFAGDLDEIEVVPRYRDDRLDLALEVDRDGGLFSEVAGTDESHTRVAVTEPDPDAVADDLRATVEEFA